MTAMELYISIRKPIGAHENHNCGRGLGPAKSETLN